MTCPICNQRPAKRCCPALSQEICPVCCATKRLVEIRCPSDCQFLENSLRHPAAAVRRQMDHDIALLVASLGRVTEEQLQLFFLLQATIVAHRPDGIARVIDADVALATGAVASSLESSVKGVIYEEATTSQVAEGLRKKIRTIVDEIAKRGGTRAEREIAIVLRGIERGASHVVPEAGVEETSYLELVTRVLQRPAPGTAPPGSTLIISP